MISNEDTPDGAYFYEVGGDRRIHPYGMHKTVNQRAVEVVDCVTDADNHPRRYVLVRDGQHEVWVQGYYSEECGDELQPEERVSSAEFHAISLKQTAIQDGSNVPIDDPIHLVETGTPDQRSHALIALYYAAKANPDIPETDVDELRKLVREHTGHVDTSHLPTLTGILDEHFGDDEETSTI